MQQRFFSVPRIFININDKNHQCTHVISFSISIQEAALSYQLQAARTFKSLILSLVLNHRYIFFWKLRTSILIEHAWPFDVIIMFLCVWFYVILCILFSLFNAQYFRNHKTNLWIMDPNLEVGITSLVCVSTTSSCRHNK